MAASRRWETVPHDPRLAAELARSMALPAAAGQVLAGRGLASAEEAGRFLNPRLSDVSDPFLLPGMEAAVARINRAVESGERIVVFGDYDADGVTSTALLLGTLRAMGSEAHAFLPERMEEGYGLTAEALQRCIRESRPELIVTVDCGTCSVEAVEAAAHEGIDVVVTDHHEAAGAPAPAVAIVNPRLAEQPETELLAGVGVAFKLAHGLVKSWMERHGGDAPGGLDLRRFLDLVAIGTVADVVPLTRENRILVHHGILRMNRECSPGIAALLSVAGVENGVDSYHLGFLIGPRLNAAGRLGKADPALDVLLEQNAERALALARELDETNRERRRIEEDIQEAAVRDIECRCNPETTFGLVAGRTGWHVGTVGIVASRIANRYHRPTVVIGFDERGLGRGSARSISGVNMVRALEACAEWLDGYGGHEMAAGLTLQRGNLEAFRTAFEAHCSERLAPEMLEPVIRVDAWVALGEANRMLLESVERLSPFGMGNPTPMFGVRGVRPVGRARLVGRNHLKMVLGDGETSMEAIGFDMADRGMPDGPVDVLFHLKENTYGGRTTLQMHIKDFRSAQAEA